jgi:hypothetical protein
MRHKLFLIPALLSIVLFYSCGEPKAKFVDSSGKTAEMLIVTDNEDIWKGKIGDTIRGYFYQDFQVLPQPEGLFDLAWLGRKSFDNSKMMKTHHNIFIIEMDETLKEAKLKIGKDRWAYPQYIVQVVTPSIDEFIKLYGEKKDIIYEIFMDSERARLLKMYKSFADYALVNELKEHFDFSLMLSGGFYIAKKSSNFAWLRKETEKLGQGLLIYTFDYTDTIAFKKESIMAMRNSITKEYVPGPNEGSYMTIQEKYSPVISKRIDFKGMFAVETRGLWKVEGNFMGGPFINYTFVDEKRNKVITLDAYVYAPNKEKRDMMVQMEGIIYSVKFNE